MAVKVDTVNVLKKYFTGVADRAEHHAPNISEIIYTLLGIIILKMDEGTDIQVKGETEDLTKNILWVTINEIRYAFRYEHSDDSIEIREGSFKGPISLKVDNSTPISHILNIFS